MTAIAPRQIDVAFNFSVTITGVVTLGEFLEVSGISQSFEVHEHQEGGNATPHYLLGPKQHERIVLKWGLVNSSAFYDWVQKVQLGQSFRYNVTIYQYARGPASPGAQPPAVRTYLLRGAYPVRWQAPALNSMTNDVPVEELELVYQFMTVTVAA